MTSAKNVQNIASTVLCKIFGKSAWWQCHSANSTTATVHTKEEEEEEEEEEED